MAENKISRNGDNQNTGKFINGGYQPLNEGYQPVQKGYQSTNPTSSINDNNLPKGGTAQSNSNSNSSSSQNSAKK